MIYLSLLLVFFSFIFSAEVNLSFQHGSHPSNAFRTSDTTWTFPLDENDSDESGAFAALRAWENQGDNDLPEDEADDDASIQEGIKSLNQIAPDAPRTHRKISLRTISEEEPSETPDPNITSNRETNSPSFPMNRSDSTLSLCDPEEFSPVPLSPNGSSHSQSHIHFTNRPSPIPSNHSVPQEILDGSASDSVSPQSNCCLCFKW